MLQYRFYVRSIASVVFKHEIFTNFSIDLPSEMGFIRFILVLNHAKKHI